MGQIVKGKRRRMDAEQDNEDEDIRPKALNQQHKRWHEEVDADGDPSSSEPPSSEDNDSSNSDSEGHDALDHEKTLEEQVADIPFETLETLRQDGRGPMGSAARAAALKAKQAAREGSFKRANKDRPQEMSSKRPTGRFREVLQVPHSERRDPRFDEATGPLNADAFARRYSFVYNDVLPKEKAELQAKIKKEKRPVQRAKLQSALSRVDQSLRDEEIRRRTQSLEQDWKSKERSAVASGKSPFFLKAADKKRMALLAKYQVLQERGKLDKFMEKRRKQNAAKDHRYLPSGRRAAGGED